jgi:tRNA(Ile)-lysidine synthase
VDPLCEQVRSVVQAHLQAKKPRLLVAVSGGLDSMVLLHVLHRLSEALPLEMAVAHFDHQLRGRASARDAEFVRRSAQKLGLRVFLGSGDVRARAASCGVSIEMAARDLRYAFLAQVAAEEGLPEVVTAHHADDQVELFFIRLLRGAGGDGLSGMSVSSSFPERPKLRLFRPLLGCYRRDLVAWGRSQRVKFREDRSNRSPIFLRNRIRHQLIPTLHAVQGEDPTPNLLRSMELIEAETASVTESARAWLGKPPGRATDFPRLDVALQRQVIRLQLLEQHESVTYTLVESLRREPGQVITAPGGTRWQRATDGRISRVQVSPSLDFRPSEACVRIAGKQGAIVFAERNLEWELRSRLSLAWIRRSKPGVEVFDADLVGSEICLRHWRPGDRFRPLGLRASSKLQDLFINAKIPAAERRQRLVAESVTASELFWVEGLRVSHTFQVTAGTRRFLVWRWDTLERG